jgi:diguanylate cyclase (GGDEF)-like protein
MDKTPIPVGIDERDIISGLQRLLKDAEEEMQQLRLQLSAKSNDLEARILEIEVLQKELEEKNARLEALSSLDNLTGLFNRRYFDDNLVKEWRQAFRTQTPLSLLLVRIADFQGYGECPEQWQDEACLQQVAHGLYQALLRPVDIVARYARFEFAILLPGTDRKGAQLVAERMLEQVEALDDIVGEAMINKVTLAIGGSTVFPRGEKMVSLLVQLAGRALDEAEKAGDTGRRVRFLSGD